MSDKLSKHLQQCLDEIKQRKITPFQPIDFWPKIKRTEWVFRKLVNAGYLQKTAVGLEIFYQLTKKAKND